MEQVLMPRVKPEDVGMSSERLSQIRKFVNAEVEGNQLPGAVVAIARRGKLVFFEAFGHRDKAAGLPMTTDAIFGIASMTKPMVAVAALQLFEQGRLLMDDPLAKYFPEFSDMKVVVLDAKNEEIVGTVPAARKITIQDLFRHTSSLSYGRSGTTAVHKMYPLSSDAASSSLTGSAFLDLLSSLPLPYQPGTVWEYGFGLDVLGLVIEAITAKPLSQYLQENVWHPLGMVDTGYIVPPGKLERFAAPLPNDPTTGLPQSVPSPTQTRLYDCGGTGVHSTTADYLRFAQMLLDGGACGSARILGRKTVEYMLANHLGPDIRNQVGSGSAVHTDYAFGLGVAVRTIPGVARTMGSVGEFSWPGAFGTYWWADPREQLVAVWMVSTPAAAQRAKYRFIINSLVNQAIVD
ncbi:MAG: beta-lactamase family protein [Reyranella sp.]|nr:beta-lactamase family protein [Reyranella sp.]MBL6653063.1 beta-lactamase family protein [Reyranella sp.]